MKQNLQEIYLKCDFGRGTFGNEKNYSFENSDRDFTTEINSWILNKKGNFL